MKRWMWGAGAFFFLCATVAVAQGQDEIEITRSVIEAKRKALIANNMELSEAKSQAFWHVYNEYQEEMRKVNDQRINVMLEYAKNLDNMSDEKAAELMKQYFEYEGRWHKVRKAYVKKFQKVLTTKQVARFYQIENKMDAIINYDLAKAVPLVR